MNDQWEIENNKIETKIDTGEDSSYIRLEQYYFPKIVVISYKEK